MEVDKDAVREEGEETAVVVVALPLLLLLPLCGGCCCGGDPRVPLAAFCCVGSAVTPSTEGALASLDTTGVVAFCVAAVVSLGPCIRGFLCA